MTGGGNKGGRGLTDEERAQISEAARRRRKEYYTRDGLRIVSFRPGWDPADVTIIRALAEAAVERHGWDKAMGALTRSRSIAAAG